MLALINSKSKNNKHNDTWDMDLNSQFLVNLYHMLTYLQVTDVLMQYCF